MEMPDINEELLEGGNVETLTKSDEETTHLDESGDGDADEQVGLDLDPTENKEEEEGGEAMEQMAEEGEDTLDDKDISKMDEEEEDEGNMENIQKSALGDEDDPDKPSEESLDGPPIKKLKDDEHEGLEQKDDANGNAVSALKEETNKEAGSEKKDTDTDMLSTLASAALDQNTSEASAPAETTPTATPVKAEPETPKKKLELWFNVGVFDTNSTIVTDYTGLPELADKVDLVNANFNGKRIHLEPGTAYKFRVCAVNSCGTGPWSEVAAFKTTLPGFPGAPSAIKISKSPEGAHLTWEPPGGNSGEILEYAVYLAVRNASQGSQPVATNNAQLAFVRVFCGPTNKCVVGSNSLQAAHIDVTTKPAIIFRIAAKNAKGYGPATQVRWLQETTQNQNGAGTQQGVKRTLKA